MAFIFNSSVFLTLDVNSVATSSYRLKYIVWPLIEHNRIQAELGALFFASRIDGHWNEAKEQRTRTPHGVED